MDTDTDSDSEDEVSQLTQSKTGINYETFRLSKLVEVSNSRSIFNLFLC